MKIYSIIKSPWTLFVVALVCSAFRLRAGSLIFILALAPIVTISVISSIYESLDKYIATKKKPLWLKLPFASYISQLPRFSSSQKQVIAFLAVFWALLLSAMLGQSTQ